jgi:N-acetylglucosaminyldiphosphoundecaprenol N-acetyl-beta-D-mannosaminyltransferase
MSANILQAPVENGAFRTWENVSIGRAKIHRCSLGEAVDAIASHAASRGKPAYVVTPNAQHIVLLERDARLRRIYDEAALVTPDGMSLVVASNLLGGRLKQRVAGVDLFEKLCERAEQLHLRVFLLGGCPGSAELAAAVLKRRYSSLVIQTLCPPMGFERDEEQLNQIRATILAASPHLLFAALGAPKQEYWVYDWGTTLGVPVCVGVGGSFEMVAGVVPRAPEWVQRLGMEWLFRLLQEPRRLWRRYLIGNTQFIGIVLAQFLRRLRGESV